MASSSVQCEENERTFIMVKPDGVHRGLVGTVIQRFEQKQLKLRAMKFVWPNNEFFAKMYAAEENEPYFPLLMKHMMSGPVVPMVWEGTNAIKIGRLLIGESEQIKCRSSTVRGDMCLHIGRNVIHGSDSIQSANVEIHLWFTPEELVPARYIII